MEKLNKYKINYAIEVSASAKKKPSQLYERLSAVKAYKVTRNDDDLTLISEGKDRLFRCNLSASSISIELFAEKAVENPKKELLLMLFEILSGCDWQYGIDLTDIYGHITDSFAKNQLNYYSNAIKEINANEYSDIVLAKRIIGLKRKNAELEEIAAKLHNKLSRVAPDVIIGRFSHGSTLQEIIEYTGLDKPEVEAALKELPNLGYKIIGHSGNKLNVVKI